MLILAMTAPLASTALARLDDFDPSNDGLDTDSDGDCDQGDVDDDGDGTPDLVDNCPLVSNPTQNAQACEKKTYVWRYPLLLVARWR